MVVRMFNFSDSVIFKIEKAHYNAGHSRELEYTLSQILDQVNPARPVHTVYMDETDFNLVSEIIPEISAYEVPYVKAVCDLPIRVEEYADLMFALMVVNAPQDILYGLTESMAHHKGCLYGEYLIHLTPHFCRWFLDNINRVREEYTEEDDKIFDKLRIVCMKRGF